MLKLPFAVAVFISVLLASAQDPCTVATSGTPWVSAKQAHACELAVPFDKDRSLKVIDSAVKSLPYDSLQTWFLNSPNPLIPHNVDIKALLNDIKKKVTQGAYKTDWDFNVAVQEAYNKNHDGHNGFNPGCTTAFSYNLPFSIATLADSPYWNPLSGLSTQPYFLVNYDFPDQFRTGLESYYKALNIDIRQYDGAKVTKINGQDASSYLQKLADASSVHDGLFGSMEDIGGRYVRLMSRYSADTADGGFTQELGRFGTRPYYPGAESITVELQLSYGKKKTLTIPWAARFLASGNDTPSFISANCFSSPTTRAQKREEKRTERDNMAKRHLERRDDTVKVPHANLQNIKAVIDSDTPLNKGPQARFSANAAGVNYVTPSLTSFGHFVTLDLYQLKKNPKVGVIYFEQFAPSDGTDFFTYVNGISSTLYSGITALKAAGVKKILIDTSGNRGGYIFAGAVALWSLWPQDLYPGFPAVFRDLNLTNLESKHASDTNDQFSEYNYRFYRDLKYKPLTSNAQFLDPPVPTIINGVKDAYSHPFFDDFGNSSADVTNFTAPAFDGSDYVIVTNGFCGSTCSVFSSYLWQKHGVKSAVFGGIPSNPQVQFDYGVKGSEVTDFDTILFELELAGLSNDPNAPQPFPITASLTYNYRNAIPYVQKQFGILEYVYEAATKRYLYTKENFNKPEKVWEFVAGEFFPHL